MIREQLDKPTKSILDKLIEEGKPDHPEFLSWMSEVELITDESPYSESELSKLAPNRLFETIKLGDPWRIINSDHNGYLTKVLQLKLQSLFVHFLIVIKNYW